MICSTKILYYFFQIGDRHGIVRLEVAQISLSGCCYVVIVDVFFASQDFNGQCKSSMYVLDEEKK